MNTDAFFLLGFRAVSGIGFFAGASLVMYLKELPIFHASPCTLGFVTEMCI